MSDWNWDMANNGINKVGSLLGSGIDTLSKFMDEKKKAEYNALLEEMNKGNLTAQFELGKRFYEKEHDEIGIKLIDDAAIQGFTYTSLRDVISPEVRAI